MNVFALLLAAVLLVTPAVYVVLVENDLRRRVAALGRYTRLADGLRVAVAGVFLYFAWAVFVAATNGELAIMIEAPLSRAALLGWVRLCLADVMFFLHWRISAHVADLVALDAAAERPSTSAAG